MLKRFLGRSKPRRDDARDAAHARAPANTRTLGFDDPARLERFLARVREHFARRGRPVTIDDGWVLPGGRSDQSPARYGLTNLAARASRTPENEWPSILAEHFDAVTQTTSRTGGIGDNPELDTVRGMLAVRLFHPSALNSDDPATLTATYAAREDLPGLLTALVLNGDGWVRSLRRETVHAWGVELSELFDIALRSVRERVSFETALARTDGGTEFIILESDSLVASGAVLCLDELEGMLGAHGSVIAAPLRNLLLAAPLGEQLDPKLCGVLGELSADLCNSHEGPIWPELYWTDGRAFVRLGTPQAVDRLLAHGVPGRVANLLA